MPHPRDVMPDPNWPIGSQFRCHAHCAAVSSGALSWTHFSPGWIRFEHRLVQAIDAPQYLPFLVNLHQCPTDIGDLRLDIARVSQKVAMPTLPSLSGMTALSPPEMPVPEA